MALMSLMSQSRCLVKQFEGKEVLIGQLVGEDEGEKQSAISCRINSSTNQLATKQQPRDGDGE